MRTAPITASVTSPDSPDSRPDNSSIGHTSQAADIRARHAACLAYALRPMTDAQLQADIAWLSSELGIEDELDVFEALDDLMTVLEH